MPGTPTLAEVRAYIGVGAASLPDDQLQRIYDACIQVQASRCRDTDDPVALPDDLAQALLRRVQGEVAAKALPLGLVGPEQGEFGPARIPYFDSRIETLEAAHRRVVVG